jgi:hypothetical protein
VEDCLPAPAAAAAAATQAASWEEAAVEAEVPEATKAAEKRWLPQRCACAWCIAMMSANIGPATAST